jgi:hypothetical protein
VPPLQATLKTRLSTVHVIGENFEKVLLTYLAEKQNFG